MKKKNEPGLDEKIVAGLERLAHVFRLLLWDKSKVTGLSPIQIQFMIYLDTHARELRKVSTLAQEFGLTQATVSDSVRTLRLKGLITQETMPSDRRVLSLELTTAGKELLRHVSPWSSDLLDILVTLPRDHRENGLLFLMELIAGLHKTGIISQARMCTLCQHFMPNEHPDSAQPHHCGLLDLAMGLADLKIDCPVHLPGEKAGKLS
jgi:DNA-binding MarR family transcriptional regulator